MGVAAVLVTGLLYGSGRVSVRAAEVGLVVGRCLSPSSEFGCSACDGSYPGSCFEDSTAIRRRVSRW
ncbi:hypothetical protein SAMN05444342_0613 [Haladaptatus paucihalophilus DX253]|uniref:Uncharacterized protein n=1 Tax=Haladaptatus paucihalophilus DX253 TaxID=797209 RepID=A0A1M6PTJ1_HALPU|nr:hypothetical protein SAMN05444342_0613 [Haladaptatus paucihalophilus DX253]